MQVPVSPLSSAAWLSLKGPYKLQVSSPQGESVFFLQKCVYACICTQTYIYTRIYIHYFPLLCPSVKKRAKAVFYRLWIAIHVIESEAEIGVDLFRKHFLAIEMYGPRYISCFLSKFSFDNLLFHLFDITFSSFYAVSDLFYFFASLLRFLFTPLVEWVFICLFYLYKKFAKEKKEYYRFPLSKIVKTDSVSLFILFYFRHIFEGKLNISIFFHVIYKTET